MGKLSFASIAGTLTGSTLATLGIVHAVGLTTVVAGPVAAAGAIKTATVLTSSGPVVLSVVKASLFSKIVCGTLCVAGAVIVGFFVYEFVKDLTKSDRKVISVAANKLA